MRCEFNINVVTVAIAWSVGLPALNKIRRYFDTACVDSIFSGMCRKLRPYFSD
jgi:hypothetical protein